MHMHPPTLSPALVGCCESAVVDAESKCRIEMDRGRYSYFAKRMVVSVVLKMTPFTPRSRLALVHLVHEARGLDTFPLTLRKIKAYEQHTTGTPPLPAETLSPSTAPGGGTCAVGGADANAAGSDVAMSTSRGCAKGQKNGTGGEGICARTLQMNAHDEVGHVGCAVKWFVVCNV